MTTKVKDLLYVAPERWFSLSKSQKEFYMTEVHKYSSEDISNKKQIRIPGACNLEEAIQVFKHQPQERIASHISRRTYRKQGLGTPQYSTINCFASYSLPKKKYLVASRKKTSYTVIVFKNKSMECSCKGFGWISLCSHSVAIAEKEGILTEFVASAKKASRAALTYPPKAGRKGFLILLFSVLSKYPNEGLTAWPFISHNEYWRQKNRKD